MVGQAQSQRNGVVIAPPGDPLLGPAGQRHALSAHVKDSSTPVVSYDVPRPRADPQVAVIVIGGAADVTGRIGGDDVIPAAAPHVVERGAGVGPRDRNARVFPKEVEARVVVDEAQDLPSGLGDDDHGDVIAAQADLAQAVGLADLDYLASILGHAQRCLLLGRSASAGRS